MPSRAIRSALVLAVLAAAVLLPATASAAPIYEVEYEVDLAATATWTIDRRQQEQYPKETFHGEITAAWTGTIENVLFRNGRMLAQRPTGRVTTPQITGGGAVTAVHWDGSRQREYTENGTCTAGTGNTFDHAYVARSASQPDPNSEGFDLHLREGLGLGFGCTIAADIPYGALFNGKAFPEGVLDGRFTLPLEAIGMGRIIQNVTSGPSTSSPYFCPGRDQYTTGCEFAWSAQLTFRKVREYQYDGDLPGGGGQQPAPGWDPRADAISKAVDQYGTPQGAPTPPPFDPRADAISKAVEQYGKEPARDIRAEIISRAVEQYGKELRITAQCQGGCTGTAEILPGTRRRAYAAATPRALAKLRFSVPAGGPRTIRLKLTPKAHRALRRAGRARVKLTMRPRSGRPVTRTLVLRRVR